jgi:hypothetical protein
MVAPDLAHRDPDPTENSVPDPTRAAVNSDNL